MSIGKIERQDEETFLLNLVMIREVRLKLTQQKMVDLLGHGLNLPRYQKWEERQAFPPIFFVRRVAEVADTPIEVLLTQRISE
ncbi:hypothetical protein [Flaviaesturariibacter amylovorans]|uniref:XRE family transcriptional regulator n=1 Tax=Flaviaesturariibacter amylovorans TaxID=1084520 RepID=A0ABP8GQH2_9BACT